MYNFNPFDQEKIYTEADWPETDSRGELGPKLDKAPRDLGFSRADLWHFAGLVALDYFQNQTKAWCNDPEQMKGLTCGDWNKRECYQVDHRIQI